MFYAGTLVNCFEEGLWPHAHVVEPAYEVADGIFAMDYQITDLSEELSLGTFCHENGHTICDFPDLYDGEDPMSSGVGAFCLMGTGGNADPKNPTQVCAYLKFHAGWERAMTPITAGLETEATAGSNEFFYHVKDDKEYYLIENRLQEGRDLALPASGLAIWHVDYCGNNENEQMTPESHYECSLKQADGCHHLERDPKNDGDVRDLFSAGINDHFGDATQPNSKWWDGSSSGLDISLIGPPGASISFRGNA